MWSVAVVVACGVHAATALVLVGACARRARGGDRVAAPIGWLVGAQGAWSALHLGETLASGQGAKVTWDALQYVPMAVAPVATAVAIHRFAGIRNRRAVERALAVVAGAPAAVLASAALGLYAHDGVRLVGSPPMLTYAFGALDTVLAVALLATMIYGGALAFRFSTEVPRLRRPATALAIGFVLPAVATLVVMSMGLSLDGDRDVTPITFALASAFLAAGVFGSAPELVPLAHDTVFARLPDPVLVFDRADRLVEHNPAAAALLRGAAIAAGTPRARVLAAYPALCGDAAVAGPVEIEADGRWFEGVMAPMTSPRGETMGHVLVLRDVTARTAASLQLAARVEARTAELARSEGRLGALFDQVSGLVGILDREGRVLAANRAALELAGVREDDLRGHWFWDTPWWAHDPAARAQLQAAIARAATGEVVQFQTSHLDAEGRRHDIAFSLTPVRDARGEVVELIPEGRDITALAEERARSERLAEQLRQSQKLESVGRLAGGIAHDFNNLLTVIRGNADELRDELGADVAGELADDIIHAADAAAQITRQLLAFSRRQPQRVELLALDVALEPARRLVGRLLREDVALTYDVPVGLAVHADATQLQQVLINLAINGQDAIRGRGAIEVVADGVELDAAAAAERALAPARYVRLRVRDTGGGMDADTRARLFEPFFTTKAEGKGTGLGLALVHGVVLQAGGAIEVASTPGEGTTFTIFLPRAAPIADAAPARAPSPPPRAQDGPHTVVLVEDQEDVRTLLDRSLRRAGYRTHVFADGAALLAAAATLTPPPDLLLTDVVLPGLSGVELARRLAPAWPGVRLLFMSGYSTGDELDALRRLPPEALIAKPFRPSELIERVRQIATAPPAWSAVDLA